MMDRKTLDDLINRIAGLLPAGSWQHGRELGEGLSNELRASLRQILEQGFARLNVLTREDFEAQLRALQRAEQRIAALEQQVGELEARLNSNPQG
ncbi:MAG: hypothetical protein RLZZ385_260 [Pseudomonadota bacterium]